MQYNEFLARLGKFILYEAEMGLKMRIDKYLKVSRLIKRRTVANEVCEQGRVKINDKVAKPGSEAKVGDIIEIQFGNNTTTIEITRVSEHVTKDDAKEMYIIK
ncbi:MAG: ribosome-associated heat shock protein implicated in recycling of subunit [Eubacterium sp.]|nr:ribosome-associated heat shock protein implicated in recycling of subunit [Eubacterium sp.]